MWATPSIVKCEAHDTQMYQHLRAKRSISASVKIPLQSCTSGTVYSGPNWSPLFPASTTDRTCSSTQVRQHRRQGMASHLATTNEHAVFVATSEIPLLHHHAVVIADC